MSYTKKEFNKLNEEFQEAAATFFDNATFETFEFVIDCYNAIIVYALIDHDRKRQKTKDYICEIIESNRTTLQRCFEELKIPAILPGKLLYYSLYQTD